MAKMVQRVQQEGKDFNLKIRSYSDNVMGYRINLCGEFHYVINDAYLAETDKILLAFSELNTEYDEHGFVILQKGYIFFSDKNYRYDRKLGKYVFKVAGSNVVPLIRYKASKIIEGEMNV